MQSCVSKHFRLKPLIFVKSPCILFSKQNTTISELSHIGGTTCELRPGNSIQPTATTTGSHRNHDRETAASRHRLDICGTNWSSWQTLSGFVKEIVEWVHNWWGWRKMRTTLFVNSFNCLINTLIWYTIAKRNQITGDVSFLEIVPMAKCWS